jgi:hypothetical protein
MPGNTLAFTILMHDQGSKVVGKFAANVSKAAGDVSKSSKTFESAGKKSGEGLGKALLGGFAGYLSVEAIRGALTGIIGGASDLNETISKTDQVFGRSSDQIHSWAKTAETSMGLSQDAAESNANSLGLLFSQVGFNSQAAAAMSKKWVQLAVDLGSFNNADPTEILGAMQSATRGEYDELQRFVPMINAATLEQKALAMTGKTVADQLTDQDKILALQALTFAQTGKAQGDFARTSTGVANQTKIATAEIQNSAAALGGELLPAAADVLQAITGDIIPTIREMGEIFSDLPDPVQLGVKAILGIAGASAVVVPAGKKIAEKVSEVREEYEALGKVGKVSVLGLGVLGLAFAAGTTILGAYAKQQADAKKAVKDLTDTLDDQGAKVTASTRLWARDELAKNGAKDAAKELGIQLTDLVTAGLDPQSEAAARVNGILESYKTAATGAYGATQQNTVAARDNAAKATLVENALKGQNNQLDEARQKKKEDIEVSKGAADANAEQAQQHETAAQKAKKEADELQNLIDQLTKLTRGALNLSTAEINFQGAIDDATAAVKDNGKTLDLNSEKGRNNRKALDDIARATSDLIESKAQQGATETQLQATQDQGTVAFYKQALAMGATQKQADALTKKYFGIPGSRLTKLTADKKDADAKIADIKKKLKDPNLTKERKAKLSADIATLLRRKKQAQDAINKLHGKTVTISASAHINMDQFNSSLSSMERRLAASGFNYYAAGTTSARRGMAIVGEEGPELVRFGGGEQVFNAAQTRRIAATPTRLDIGQYKSGGRTAPTPVVIQNYGVIGSQGELQNWLVRSLDDIGRLGRVPAAFKGGR